MIDNELNVQGPMSHSVVASLMRVRDGRYEMINREEDRHVDVQGK